MKHILILKFFLCIMVLKTYSQDSLLTKSLVANKYEFDYSKPTGFHGNGWNSIVSAATENQYTLIGEVHGTNEIPIFLKALAEQVKYETFVAEIDPFLNVIMQNKIKQLPQEQLQNWLQESRGTLSFYSYLQDLDLLKTFQKQGTDVVGIDQITASNDVPVYLYLAELTKDQERKELYLGMAKKAQQMFALILEGHNNPPYLMSSQFNTDINKLEDQKLSLKEQNILEKLVYSRGIYTLRDGHERRIKLMKNQLMNQYDETLLNKKALFRLGANHSPKGKSLQFNVFDVGNLAHNLAESQLNSSYHLAVFVKSGEAGNPFIGHPATKIMLPKDLKFINGLAADEKWTYFDLTNAKKQLESGKYKVESGFLRSLIKGYDGLVIIPESTAGEHIE